MNSTDNFMRICQILTPDSDPIYTWCVSKIREIYHNQYLSINYTQNKFFGHPFKHRLAKHRFTIDQLTVYPGSLCIDADMLPIAPLPTLPSGRMYCNGTGCKASIVGGTNTEMIQSMDNFWSKEEKQNCPKCLHEFIQWNIQDFMEIPPGYFQHLELGQLMVKGGGKNEQCEIKRTSSGYKFAWIKDRNPEYYKDMTI